MLKYNKYFLAAQKEPGILMLSTHSSFFKEIDLCFLNLGQFLDFTIINNIAIVTAHSAANSTGCSKQARSHRVPAANLIFYDRKT